MTSRYACALVLSWFFLDIQGVWGIGPVGGWGGRWVETKKDPKNWIFKKGKLHFCSSVAARFWRVFLINNFSEFWEVVGLGGENGWGGRLAGCGRVGRFFYLSFWIFNAFYFGDFDRISWQKFRPHKKFAPERSNFSFKKLQIERGRRFARDTSSAAHFLVVCCV